MISNSKRPVNRPADVRGLKIRTTPNPMHLKAFQLLGANPVPLSLSELYTALESGAVEAQEHPIGIFWSSKLYEVQVVENIDEKPFYDAVFSEIAKEYTDKNGTALLAAIDAAR